VNRRYGASFGRSALLSMLHRTGRSGAQAAACAARTSTASPVRALAPADVHSDRHARAVQQRLMSIRPAGASRQAAVPAESGAAWLDGRFAVKPVRNHHGTLNYLGLV